MGLCLRYINENNEEKKSNRIFMDGIEFHICFSLMVIRIIPQIIVSTFFLYSFHLMFYYALGD